jgi:N-acetyl-alpha-D-muramate 1-phosphate uridylyltransferase
MKAMILAAGRGERMRPLTDKTPKPLLTAAGRPLIEYTIRQLAAAGFSEIIINTSHLGEQIPAVLGLGERWNVSLKFIYEGEEPLETAGGIINALPDLGDYPFLVVNGDIATDYDFAKLRSIQVGLAHLVLIDNPSHHPDGDFHLDAQGVLSFEQSPKFTFAGIGVYHPELFKNLEKGVIKLAPILRQAMLNKRVSGEYFKGFWMDIGTPERLEALHNHYIQNAS